jgi:integrase/recombinase XerD
MNLEEACKLFLSHSRSSKNLSEHTLRAYQIDLSDLLKFMGADRELDQCSKPLFREFLAYLFETKELKASSIKRRLACIKTMFKWLEDEDFIPQDPLYRLNERITIPKRLPHALSREDMGKLLLYCRSAITWPNPEFKVSPKLPKSCSPADLNNYTCILAIEILFATGIRVGELVNISRLDLDLNAGTILINGKGNRQRLVFITDPEIIALIKFYQTIKDSHGYSATKLLLNSRGSDASTAIIRKLVKQAAKDAGIERPITPHMIRHTTATHLLEAGVDIRYVQQLLGHYSISTTQIYTHVNNSHLQTIIADLHPRKAILEEMGI